MDIQDLRYLIQIHNVGSLNKAADKLHVSQPNLSKTLQKVEEEVGFILFHRSRAGIEATEEGLRFINAAQDIVDSFGELTVKIKEYEDENFKISFAYPYSTYISSAFAKYLAIKSDSKYINVNLYESSNANAYTKIINGDCNIGIVRYDESQKQYFNKFVSDYGLFAKPLCNFNYKVLLSKNHPLANLEEIDYKLLGDYIKLEYKDDFSDQETKLGTVGNKKVIRVGARGTQALLLNHIYGSYVLAAPTPNKYLIDSNLTIKRLKNYPNNNYTDYLVYKKSYHLNKAEQGLINYILEEFKEMEQNQNNLI